MDHTKAGFIALIGLPNAGKSTLLNTLMGQKLAIVSPKAQTTRLPIRGVLSTETTQYIFVDTPGVFRGKRAMEDKMEESVKQAWQNADIALHVLDATKGLTESDIELAKSIKKTNKTLFLAVNKIDALKRMEDQLPLLQAISDAGVFDHVFPISALKNKQVDGLLAAIETVLPDSPFLYDKDQLTDMPLQTRAAELTREKAFLYLQQELPYGLAVETIAMETMETGDLRVDQHIFIERDAHKQMVIGKSGAMLKKIGTAARKDMTRSFGRKVHLFLQVKVKPNWANSGQALAHLGF